ncbi:hypothetical protein [Aquiflexum sp. TKW24L]|nr:hypothetical protein [Aquiflexum sp. TKW24L]
MKRFGAVFQSQFSVGSFRVQWSVAVFSGQLQLAVSVVSLSLQR